MKPLRIIGTAAIFAAITILSVLCMINLHEISHTIAARLAGDRQAHYVLYESDAHGSCIGCNIYDPDKLTTAGKAVVSAAGAAGTFLIAQAICISPLRLRCPVHKYFWSPCIVFAADAPIQLGQGLADHPDAEGRLTGADFADFLTISHHNWGMGTATIKALYVVVLLALLVLYFLEIGSLVCRERNSISARA